MKRVEDLKTVSKTNKMLKELFMGKPPASFKDDFFYFSLIFTLSRPWYLLNIITKNPTCLTQINPRTCTQSHIPRYPYRGTRGVMGPLPRGFDMLQYLGQILPSFESLWYFRIRWGIFYGWSRCWRPVTSPNMVAILDFTKNK